MTNLTFNGAQWLNSHSVRNYPVADNAISEDDTGQLLLPDVLLDMQLRWPAAFGDYGFISGITVTDKLFSIMFAVGHTLTSAADVTTIGGISLRQPAATNQPHSLQAWHAGVHGFVAIGDVRENYVARFSTPQQSLLLHRVAKSYHTAPIQGIGRSATDKYLQGLVTLAAGTDIRVRKTTINWEDNEREAIAIGLAPQQATGENLLAKYAGPAGTRPENSNCQQIGILGVGDATPDCDGNIEIQFERMAASAFSRDSGEASGLLIHQRIGMASACPTVPLSHTIIRSICEPSEAWSAPWEHTTSPGSICADNRTQITICGDWGDTDTATLDSAWTVAQGTFTLTSLTGEPPQHTCYDEELQDVCMVVGNDTSILRYGSCLAGGNVNKRLTTEFRFGSPFGRAGVVLDHYYRSPGNLVFYTAVVIDYATKELQVITQEGSQQRKAAIALDITDQLDEWVTLQVRIAAVNTNTHMLAITASRGSAEFISHNYILSLPISPFAYFGLIGRGAGTEFYAWELKEIDV